PPGTKRGVHVQFYGHLLGEIVRRVKGASVGTVWRTELAPALDADVFVGVPAAEHARIAQIIDFSPAEKQTYLANPGSMLYRVAVNPPIAFEPVLLNSPLWWRLETSGYGSADAVARVFVVFSLVNRNRHDICEA